MAADYSWRYLLLVMSIFKVIVQRLGIEAKGSRLAGQMSGREFEKVCEEFVRSTFAKIGHLRPGHWEVGGGTTRFAITSFDQYEHLALVERIPVAGRPLCGSPIAPFTGGAEHR